jgi:hypothetical protein
VNYTVWLKPFNEGGNLGVCGFIESHGTGLDNQLIEAWYRQADLFLNDTHIGRASFLSVREQDDRQARCVRTTAPWEQKFDGPLKLNARGGTVRVLY